MASMNNQSRVIKATKITGPSGDKATRGVGHSSGYAALPQDYKERAAVRANEVFQAQRRARIARNERVNKSSVLS